MEHQQLENTYKSFYASSRYLTEEKKVLKRGTAPLDTSVGLVSIIREYFLFRSRINEFLRSNPTSPVIIKLIEADDTLQRLDIILKSLKGNLCKGISAENPNKRKIEQSDEEFNISQSNTSTPETRNPPKRARKWLTKPLLTLSAKKHNTSKSLHKSPAHRNELNYVSTSDTSEKEDDDDEDDNDEQSPMRKSTSSPAAQVLHEEVS